MVRSTLYTDVSYNPYSWLRLTTIFELSVEYMTSYLSQLDDITSADLWEQYSRWDFREFYGDFQLGKRFLVRLGRQQVVWGDTDFFRGIDLVHGFDYTWRSFLEAENEYLRIPLIMANIMVQVPELKGNLQLLVRPGVDKDNWIGNRYDLYGGRWASKPGKGTNFFDLLPYNLDHEEGDQNEPSYGARWFGTLGSVEYTLNYLHTFNEDPVVNSVFAPWESTTVQGAVGEFIYPMIDLVGFTTNVYVPWIDIVLRTEVSYTWSKPFNVGQDFLGGALPGFAGIKEKDALRYMVNFDKNVDFVKWLFRAERPGFFSVQVFDTWVMDFTEADDLVQLAGFGAPLKEHTSYITAILGWNYLLDRINPQLAWGTSPIDGSGFIIPSVSFVYGDHLRLKVEYDLFYNNSGKSPGEIEDDARTFHYFDDNDQLYFRLMYQF
jgi:hypothetical protein